MNAARLHAKEGRLEKSLWAAESLIANGDDLSVRKLIGLLQRGGGGSSSHFLLEVQSNVAELLLDVSHDFPLGSGGERVSPLSQDLHQVIGQISAGQIKTKDGVG